MLAIHHYYLWEIRFRGNLIIFVYQLTSSRTVFNMKCCRNTKHSSYLSTLIVFCILLFFGTITVNERWPRNDTTGMSLTLPLVDDWSPRTIFSLNNSERTDASRSEEIGGGHWRREKRRKRIQEEKPRRYYVTQRIEASIREINNCNETLFSETEIKVSTSLCLHHPSLVFTAYAF